MGIKNNKPSNKVSFWRNSKSRSLIFQIVAIALVISLAIYLVFNTLHNLETRGIQSGFSFLNEEAGFGILQSLIPYEQTDTFGRTFFVGLLNTILVSILAIIFASALGLSLGIARLSKNWLVSKLAAVYIETFRNIPVLLQVLFWYFAILPILPSPKSSLAVSDIIFLNNRGLYIPSPILESGFLWTVISFFIAIVAVFFFIRWGKKYRDNTGKTLPTFRISLAILIVLPTIIFIISGSPLYLDYPSLQGFNFKGGWSIIPELVALVLALSIYTAAYIAEIVRSGIESVDHGQTEASKSLGLSPSHTLRLIIIPQAMRVIVPQLTSQYLNLTKNSSLAPAIGYPDLVSVFAGTTLNQTGQAIEIIIITMSVYLLISLSISAFMNWYNKRTELIER